MPIDPPITYRPDLPGADPEPIGSDRFEWLLTREVEHAPPAVPRRFVRTPVAEPARSRRRRLTLCT